MSGCDQEAVEAYALGELEGARAGQVRAHLGDCAACSRELALWRAERRAFAARARQHDARPLPAFEAVLAASRREPEKAVRSALFALPARSARPRWPTLKPPPAWFGLGAFAAAAALLMQFLPGAASPLPFSADDGSVLACRLDEPMRLDLAVASAEDAFRACLMVTPSYQPPPAGVDDGDDPTSHWR
ncbi:MAG: zf-HC2 domain-containing protein [Polyangiaceae bacterium]|nr:zf-HC2 domain-containing protein [Polyangiaceae bacterium]